MLIAADAIDAYSIAILAGAPYAHIIAQSLLSWPLIFLVFSLPAINLFINLGFVSGAGPVLTFARIAPIASGVGWALTWLVSERLFLQSLSAAQNLLYFIYSLRTRLDWAVDCGHPNYNNAYCMNFSAENVTLDEVTYWPDNNWPAQQFNRYGVRKVSLNQNLTKWAPNAWYFVSPGEKFTFAFSSFPLTFCHFLVWAILFSIVLRWSSRKTVDNLGSFFFMSVEIEAHYLRSVRKYLGYTYLSKWFRRKFGSNPGKFLSWFCFALPVILFSVLDLGLFIFGFKFTGSSEKEVPLAETEEGPVEYFSGIHGFYRTSIVLMDYCSAFSGLILFASSKLRSSSLPMNAVVVVLGQMFAPILLYLLRTGCSGHLYSQQAAYRSYIATEAVFSFDSAAVCFATSRGGPLWALLYYSANFLYACVGPMTIFLLFIHNIFVEQFPALEHYATQVLALICSIFAFFGVFLLMPMGTSLATLFSYVSQSSITQIFAFVVVVFIYGWYNLDADVRLMLSSTETYVSLFHYLIGPTSPLYTVFLLSTVPALLASKFASVFDLLMSGKDVVKHIESGTHFLTGSLFINHLIGYTIMFGPITIVAAFALFAFYKTALVYKMPWGSMLDPTSDWHSNFSLRQSTVPRPAPLSHRLYLTFTKLPYHKALFIIFMFEITFGIILLMLLFSDTIYSLVMSARGNVASNNFRSLIYITFTTFHILSLLEVRWALKKWDHSSRSTEYWQHQFFVDFAKLAYLRNWIDENRIILKMIREVQAGVRMKIERLNLCIANSTMEMAFLNGYMWSSAMNHVWGFQLIQFLVIFVNTSLRGAIIAVLIAIRWNMAEQSHPTHIRDATEIYDASADLDNDGSHEDNAPIIYEMHRDVFS
ncbi:unnamed protein product [Enterobius vermicularis]|uniref:Lipase_3 domain-containing protein n=1 Tax=Enterobius vermicularis TaxID=51028 RepID=A0A0N4V543_ENTVE|nr:unnamed protein product [Enterobius vermicularis]